MKLNGPHKIRYVALFVIGCCVATIPEGFAQTVAGPGAATATTGAKSSPKGLARVISGVKSYKAAKMDNAISNLSLALSAGGLSSKDMAKALYYRGLAYRRKAKPGEAIADLTSAVWLKNGLSDTERQDAIKNRSEAYREAGITDPGLPSSVVGAAAAPAPAPSASGGTGWKTATQSKTGAQSPVRSGLAPEAAASTSASSSTTSSSGTLSSVGGFFSNLFSGGGSSSSSGSTSNTPAAQPTKSAGGLPPGIGVPGGTPGAASPPLTTSSTGPASAVSAWSSATQVAKKTAKKTVVAKAAVPSKPAVPAPIVAKGKYKVRLAAVRSRDEAAKVISTLTSKHAAALGARKPEIATVSYGNMGTFFNVHVGPFAKARDTAALCASVKSSGLDCLLVTK